MTRSSGLKNERIGRAAKLFFGTVIVSAFIVAGTLWWSHHITGDLAAAKTELASLNIKLKHTPVIIHFHGKEFVRVLRDSEMSFTRGDGSDVPGRYSSASLLNIRRNFSDNSKKSHYIIVLRVALCL